MRRRKLILFTYIFLSAVLMITALQCSTDEDESDESILSLHTWLNLHDSVEYVGMETCRRCHEDIYQSFSQTGMGQSFDHATTKKSAADFHGRSPIFDKHADLYYRPYWQDTALMVEEYRLAGKDTVYKRIEHIDYIIGSGHHTNSHIFNVNGYLYQAPFTWYVQKGRWDLPPGYEGGFNSRFNRSIGLECISCHNGYPKFVEGSINKFLTVPTGIDCERCHGPGSLHVAEKLKGNVVNIQNDTDFTIVNPRKLPYELQIDVCQRCHLQGNTVLKEGKSFFDFKPGMKLSTVMEVFMPVFEGNEEAFLMASHAERLHKSPCFIESHKKGKARQMTCLSCHNPHVSVKVTTEETFISKCMNCHTDLHENSPGILLTKGENCISCHMPTSGSIDIPHVTITDHHIRVVRDNPEQEVSASAKFKGLVSVNSKNPDILTRAKAYLYFFEKFDHKPFYLDSAYRLLRTLSRSEILDELIYYHYLKDDFQSVVKLAEEHKQTFEEAVSNYQVGQSYINIDNYDKALTYVRKAVEQQPYNLDYRLKLSTIYTYLNNFTAARKELDFVMKENPKLPAVWNNIGFLRLAEKDITSADTNFRKALSLDPDYVPARINLAKVWLFTNNIDLATRELKRILAKDPENTEARQLLELINENTL